MIEIDKNELKRVITEYNNVATNNGISKRCRYDEEKNIVVIESEHWNKSKEFTPLGFFSMLRCSGWEYVPEEDKKLK